MYAAETIFIHIKTISGLTTERSVVNMTLDSAANSSLTQWAGRNVDSALHHHQRHHNHGHHHASGDPSQHQHSNHQQANLSACGEGEGEECGGPVSAMSSQEVAVLATLLVAVFLCSLVANALVVVVFSKRRRSLSLSNRFLANLTLCNVLFTLLIMPFAFVSLLWRRWLFGPWLCQITGLGVNLLVTASILTLVVISLDRYCAVVTPLHYGLRMTRRRCWAFIAGIWLASLGVAVPPLLGWNSFRFHVNKMICTVDWASPDPRHRYYTLFLVSLSFLLPLVAMLWTYICIFRAARDNSERTRRSSIMPTLGGGADAGEGPGVQATPINKRRRSSSVPIMRRLSQTSSRSNSLLQRREEWKTAVTSFLILFSFIICWLPYFVVIVIRSLFPDLPLHPVVSTISTVAAMFACACNPMVYVFRCKGTRHDLRAILTRKRSFHNEAVQSIRRAGSMRSDRSDRSEGRAGPGAGPGAAMGSGGVAEREKGSVYWHDDMFSHGECHSIQEEADQDPALQDLSDSSSPPNQEQTLPVDTITALRSSPSLQEC